jgi:SAM-dependent methyltransferase
LRTEGGSRARDAWAVGLGLFIGFSPLIGLHLGICLLVGWLLGLNRVKLYLSANLANPLIMPFILFAEVQTGAWLRQGHAYEMTMAELQTMDVWHFGQDLFVGSLIVGAIAGALVGALTFATLGRAFRDPEYGALVKTASDRYLACGITAWEFARGKLRRDPIYRQVVTSGLLPVRGRLLDVGCGQGLTLAIVAAASAAARAGAWPSAWAAPPRDLTLTGVELRPRIAQMAQDALGAEATVYQQDARSLAPEPSDAIVVFDVLHLLSASDQEALLAALIARLAPGGRLLVREADAAGGWRFRAVRFGNWLTAMSQRRWHPAFHFRSAEEWRALLQRLGLDARTQPMGDGTPFANVLLVGEKSH